MSRITTFSRTFPGYHPKSGEPTFFVEKIYNWLPMTDYEDLPEYLMHLNPHINALRIEDFCESLECKGETYNWPKYHTIRAGHRWKEGDVFSPRIWSGNPYRSPQIQFAPDIEIKKVWDFNVVKPPKNAAVHLNNKVISVYNEDKNEFIGEKTLRQISANDGLAFDDFLHWFKFPSPFDGQIIAWDENVNY